MTSLNLRKKQVVFQWFYMKYFNAERLDTRVVLYDWYGVFKPCQHFEISYSRYANKHYITGVYIAINDIYR